ncbi:MAG: histidine kinase [bacterium]|nr:MAG: histidine kinase [bacterium]
MYNVNNLTISDIANCRNGLRDINKNANSMEEVAERMVRYFYGQFIDSRTNKKACALVRIYKTIAYTDLDINLRIFADSLLTNFPKQDSTRCLTLLATAGEQPNWNSRKLSAGHKTIPLPSELVIGRLPMISQLIKQLGVEINAIIKPDSSLIVDMSEKLYNVFFIADALGSSYIPAQKDFVIPYGIKSVVGFGSLLPGGDLLVTILFLRTSISQETAELFKSLALGTKTAVLPFVNRKIFDS